MLEAFLDIETSGLKHEEPYISVIGLQTKYGQRQFAGADERENLRAFAEYYLVIQDLAKKSGDELVFVTYNGTTFDIPVMLESSQRFHPFYLDLQNRLEKQKQIDLMPVARKYLVNFGKDIDDSTHYISKDNACSKMGIYVPRSIDGGECARIAKRYQYSVNNPPDKPKPSEIRIQEQNLLEFYGILEHNAIDLYATASLYYKMKWSGWL